MTQIGYQRLSLDYNIMMRQMLAQHSNNFKFVVATLYKFVSLGDAPQLRETLQDCCDGAGVYGTILLADEGINGTIAASAPAMTTVLTWLQNDCRFDGLSLKFSACDRQPFLRMKVRLKREIVTMGCPDIKPAERTGTYVEPADWNALISDPDVMVIDTRNSYETAIGMFDGAIDPNTTNFRDFPSWASDLAKQPKGIRPKKLALYCTGGIRCEKATALMQDFGFDEVYHLKGGILKYFEEVAAEQSKWQGECFVFDGRVAVNHDLRPGTYHMCHACRMPLSETDLDSNDYQDGVSCPHCKPSLDPQRAARFAERQKQIRLAAERGEQHLGRSPRKKLVSSDKIQNI